MLRAAACCLPRPISALIITVVVYYCRTYVKAVRAGGGELEEGGRVLWDQRLRAAACVDESDPGHHALMYVRHGQTVREEGVGEARSWASARNGGPEHAVVRCRRLQA